MTRKFMIEANETLISLTTGKHFKNKQWFRETPFLNAALTDAEVLEELRDDEIISIRRLNTDTWASEDITEEVARKYLFAMDERCGIELDDEDRFPAYVRSSKAWALWKDDLEAEARVNPSIYSTLNHRTQGLQKVGA